MLWFLTVRLELLPKLPPPFQAVRGQRADQSNQGLGLAPGALRQQAEEVPTDLAHLVTVSIIDDGLGGVLRPIQEIAPAQFLQR